MLDRDLDRVATELCQGIVNALRAASIQELAELLPEVRKLVAGQKRGAPAAPVTKHVAAKRPVTSARENPAQLADSIVRALTKAKDGMRSEELQKALRVSTLPLRVALASLVDSKKVKRTGQARGTRYFPAERAAPPPPAPAIEVSVEALNAIRALLAGSTVPLSLGEIGESASLGKDEARAGLDKLIELGFASRHGHGLGVRYHLATGASDPRAAQGEAPRVVRRPPRAKEWTAATGDEHAESAAHEEATSEEHEPAEATSEPEIAETPAAHEESAHTVN